MKNKPSKIYTLWLPLNKDTFGFDEFWKAELNLFTHIYQKDFPIEYPVLLRTKELLEDKSFFSNKSDKKILYEKDDLEDKRSRTRQLAYKIYEDNNPIGTFMIFSNGLYKWEFQEEINRLDFMSHIEALFDTKFSTPKKEEYKGILNYFQLELLQDILYNIHIPPSYFFRNEAINIEEFSKIFSLENIFKSIILYEDKEIDGMIPFSHRDTYRNKLNLRNEEEKDIYYFSKSMEHFIRVSNTFSLEHYKRSMTYCLKELSELGNMRTGMSDNATLYRYPSIERLKVSMIKLESYHSMLYEKLPQLKYLNSLYKGLSQVHSRENDKTLLQAIRQNSRRVATIYDIFRSIEKQIEIENTKNIHFEIAELRKNNEINNQLMFDSKEKNNLNMQSILKKTLEQNNKILSDQTNKMLNHNMFFMTFLATFIAFATPIITDTDKKDGIKNVSDIIMNLGFSNIFWISVIMGILVYLYFKLPKIYFSIKDYCSNRESKFNFMVLKYCVKEHLLIFKESCSKIKFSFKTLKKCVKDSFLTFIENQNEKILGIKSTIKTNEKSIPKKTLPSLYVFDNSNIDVKNNYDVMGENIYRDLIKWFSEGNSIITLNELPSLFDKNKKIRCIKFDSIRERYRSYKLYKFTFLSDYENNGKYQYTLDIDIQHDTVGKDTKIKNIRIAIINHNELEYKELLEAYTNMHDIKRDIIEKLNKFFEKIKGDKK